MHNLTSAQVHELLQLLASGIKAYQNGNLSSPAYFALVNWVQQNAPEYLK